jgi:excisionase family DNA binding protein
MTTSDQSAPTRPLLPSRLLPDPEECPTVPLWPTAGHALGISRSTAYEMVAQGQMPGVIRAGRLIRISTAALRRHLGLDEAA